MSFRIAVLASGNGTDFQSIIDGVKSGYIDGEVVALIVDRECGALERARKNAIRGILLDKKELNERFFPVLKSEIASLHPDLVVLAGFLTILPGWIVDEFHGRIINIHPSLIPAFCGKGLYGDRVHEAVLKSGARYTGCTVHFVTRGVDAGPIIEQRVVEVKDGDTVETLKARVLEEEHKLLPYVVRLFSKNRIHLDDSHVIIEKEETH
ncbi:phosphoribosylglycinamide formyltransferase [Calorimonas adulescens]|uniref:Phosphoribosylglycinamide formyltransferase n=1 Tax=Calorimonas adulescens TaxID=2606906 RepID=A0A5D8QDT6_9THEO|nr:phosphoribosylglycinamide formyltransferase [Calorimonas adulescens]TZE82547.1 phosphoribosylglycinamide formyltransferase [Calorimonas adulescens]